MNSIQSLHGFGQSIWLDFISRGILSGGELKRLVDNGVTGVTSNPSIFQKAIGESTDYDSLISDILKAQPQIDVYALYEKMAVEDIQMAADVLRPAYDNSNGADGFVSLEVSPDLAAMTEKTVSEALRLWKLVDRPNLMIKVPATPEGIPAIEALIAAGVNVNATLIFSLQQYDDVARAYIRGLTSAAEPVKVASVASFFVSRIDTAVDKALEKNAGAEALKLRGRTAVACAKMIFRRFNDIFYGPDFMSQAARGGRVQKLVWGSTGTKNPQYSDVLYVEEIIGPDTINTLPMATLNAFLDHGKPRLSITGGVDEAENRLSGLKKWGIDLDAVTDQLMKEGVTAFVQAYQQMIASLKSKCAEAVK
ncbi:MAG: transaldolase [Dehalococcoidales bacterium]|nr:transaldolase [Dehalococcoidales bacterium]